MENNNKDQQQKHSPIQGKIDNKDIKFPNWDIVPPNQIINPRIRSGS